MRCATIHGIVLNFRFEYSAIIYRIDGGYVGRLFDDTIPDAHIYTVSAKRALTVFRCLRSYYTQRIGESAC